MRESVNPTTLPTPPGYTQVIRVAGGSTIHIAGQVAWDQDGNLVGPGDFETQTRQVFINLGEALSSVGAAFADLVRIGIYVVDHDPTKLATIRLVRDEFFGDITPPASTLLGVQRLAIPDLLIEIDGVAYLED